ncbi:hypothetical protein FGO68_gene14392 [Halteria grandinella]|uniref:Uncharacterized protein n=1 Tax=Halteria grandinella TaxID=5974 RepID=A0A8J8NAX6_HALGN|nr:hypothetical protein FGO68_gene14392 [Halteria grandinella]
MTPNRVAFVTHHGSAIDTGNGYGPQTTLSKTIWACHHRLGSPSGLSAFLKPPRCFDAITGESGIGKQTFTILKLGISISDLAQRLMGVFDFFKPQA